VPLLALIALFIAVPFAELYVILEVVGPALGAPLTILLLAADSLIGALLFRSQGRTVWRRFNEALSAGRLPHREVVDGVLIVFGGAFLITPGFLTDILGIVLLLPPTRAIVRRIVVRRLGRRVVVGRAPGAASRGPGHDYDVEGTAREYDDMPRPGLER
jgi:UPF0716 protein FxsA